jgi:methylated-DNA-[protein]-cysteine S-methyltransferase
VELPGPNAHLRLNVWLALHFPNLQHRSGINPILRQAATEISEYFASSRTSFSVPFSPAGTAFQRAVWTALASIPFGETRSYRDIARMVDRAKAVRAVGAANAVNPLPLVLPCHRVIGSNGRLTGYAGGIAVKKWLLDHEAAASASRRRAGPEQPRA